MPELPEVETTRRSLESSLIGKRIVRVVVRDRRLRWPIEAGFERHVRGEIIERLDRRAKYLLVVLPKGTVMIHLGMSGSLRVTHVDDPPKTHDHVDFVLENKRCLRYHDPRRFGSMHWLRHGALHPLLAELAPEPLTDEFNGDYLYRVTRGRSAAIKQIVMNGTLVTGVGNIYASEALHLAAINPKTAAKRLSRERAARLADAIKSTLQRAIDAGGSTLRDYVNGNGDPGYFQTETAVYERDGETCKRCGGIIKSIRQGQRATYYCPRCQR